VLVVKWFGVFVKLASAHLSYTKPIWFFLFMCDIFYVLEERFMFNVEEINIQISALDRLSIQLSKTIDKWQDVEPQPKEGLSWLESRFQAVNIEIAKLLELKKQHGLPL